MAQQTPTGIVRKASTLSTLWGVSLIILGMLAVGSPFLAAVAVNAFVAWLIVLAGVVHLTVAFHTREAGSLIWRLLVGLAYICVWRVPDRPSRAGCGVAHSGAGIALSG